MRKAVRMAAVIAVLAIIAAACSDSGTPEASPSGATGGAEIQAGGTLHLAQTSDVGPRSTRRRSTTRSRGVLQVLHVADAARRRNRFLPKTAATSCSRIWRPISPRSPTTDCRTRSRSRPGSCTPPAAGRRGHGARLHPCARARGRPGSKRRRLPLLLLRHRGVRRLRCGRCRFDQRPVGSGRPHARREGHRADGDLPGAWRCPPPRRSRRIRPTPRLASVSPRATPPTTGGSSSERPYMFEGSENLDFSGPAKDQQTVAGYVPGRSIVLVRNPLYDPSTDIAPCLPRQDRGHHRR